MLAWSKHPPGGGSFNGLVGNRSDYGNVLLQIGSAVSIAERVCHCRTLLRRLLDAGIVQSHVRTKNIKFSFAVHEQKNIVVSSRTVSKKDSSGMTTLWLTLTVSRGPE